MLRGVINTRTGLLLLLAALVAEPGWSLSREAQRDLLDLRESRTSTTKFAAGLRRQAQQLRDKASVVLQ